MNSSIQNKLNSFNESYILERYQKNRMEVIDSNLLNELNSLQKYELLINQEYLYVNAYNKLEESITNFENIENYNILFDELLVYINERLTAKISLDRKYLFQELLLNFCEQKDKLQNSIKVIELLKEVVVNKLNNNAELTFILILYMRFIILSQKFNIIDKEFAVNVNNKFIESLQKSKEDFYLIAFFQYFFSKFDKKMVYYIYILETFNKYTEQLDKHILTNYHPSNKYASKIAEIYEKIDFTKKKYFYQKEIDNTLAYFQEISMKNAFIEQDILKKNMNFSNKIDGYKTKELKDLSIKFANLISKNSNEIFYSETDIDGELEKFAREHFEKIKDEYMKQINKEDKIDYLLFCFIHLYYCTEHFEIYKKKNDNSFEELFFPKVTVLDHLGFNHSVKNKDTFRFFRDQTQLNNQILVYLDNDIK